VPLPFTLTSLAPCFEPGLARCLAERHVQTYGLNARVPILAMREAKDDDVRNLADFIYRKVFLNYTMKQWGLTPERLDPGVTARVPVSIGRDNRYFQDAYQAMPEEGYRALFDRLLSAHRITVATSEDFFSIGSDITYNQLVFTGPIDAFFAYDLGALPYRSASFGFQTIGPDCYQPVATVNYPNTMAFTRVTDQRYLTGRHLQRSLLTREYPQPHVAGATEPYYPIPRAENRALHARYLARAALEAPNVIFAGRLGDYRYYNMDQAVGRALSIFRKRILPIHGHH
jgi:UDP-galactopyranose mutase